MRRTLLAAALVLFVADLSYGQTCQAFVNGAKARMSKNKWEDARQVLADELANCQGDAEFQYLYAIALARVSPDSTGKAVQHLAIADSLNGEPGGEDELQTNIDQATTALWGPIVNEGVRLLQAGDLDAAQAKLELAVQINPQGKEAQLALGAVYQGRNDFDRAIELYRRALEIDPAYKLAYLRLGQAYQLKAETYAASGDSAQVAQAQAVAEEAIGVYEDYLEDNPDDADAQVQLAGLYAALGQVEKAQPVIVRIMSADSVEPATLTDFGFRMANAGQYDLAEQLLARAVTLTDSLDVEPISYLVFVRIQKSDLPGAKAMLLKQIELAPSDAEAWEYLGLVERDLGNTAAAQEALQKADAIPLALENLRIGQDADRSWNVEATFSNRTANPVNDVTIRFSLVSGNQVLESKEVTVDGPLAAGEAESVTVEFDQPTDDARIRYEIVI
jgi:tetratricopeptide (TPR) repeat protein